MSGIYDAPSAELREDKDGSEFGSVERGIAGDYELTISGIFEQARGLISGNMGTIWIAAILMMVSAIAISFGLELILSALPFSENLSAIISQLLVTLLTTPISVGVGIVGIKLAARGQTSGTSIFNYFGYMGKLFLLTLLMYLMIGIGFVLLILPGIYLLFAYYFATPLMVEKNLGIWEAMEASRKAVTHKWFTLFFFWIILFIVVVVSALPLLIGLIWTIPLSVLCYGVIYITLFGIQRSTLDSE